MRLVKTQISFRFHAVWSESALSAWRKFASLVIQNAPNEDFDQTAQMRRRSESSLDIHIRKYRYVFWHCGSNDSSIVFSYMWRENSKLFDPYPAKYKQDVSLAPRYEFYISNLKKIKKVKYSSLTIFLHIQSPLPDRTSYIIDQLNQREGHSKR